MADGKRRKGNAFTLPISMDTWLTEQGMPVYWRKGLVFFTIEQVSMIGTVHRGFFILNVAPLFEKEQRTLFIRLLLDVSYPLCLHLSGGFTTLPANDYPLDIFKVQFA